MLVPLAIIVLGYNISINLTDVLWKEQLKRFDVFVKDVADGSIIVSNAEFYPIRISIPNTQRGRNNGQQDSPSCSGEVLTFEEAESLVKIIQDCIDFQREKDYDK